jgi:predicted ATPase/class 3 adenylate cyclase
MPVALLATDIEGSTRLLERSPEAFEVMLAQHHTIFRQTVSDWNGREFQESGDGFFMAFDSPLPAAEAVRTILDKLASARWPGETGMPRVRMALHWGTADFREGQYRGPAMHLTARLLSAAHGGQVLCSQPFAEVLPRESRLRRLGTFRLRGFDKATTIFQINGDQEFPPLRAGQARLHNLPRLLDGFVGRRRELDFLTVSLDPRRKCDGPVVVTGPGGIGKTQVALAAAHRLLALYDHAVYFVSLAGLSSPGEIPSELLKALGAGLQPGRSALELISEVLDNFPVLVVLDNFQHPASGGLTEIGALRRLFPQMRLLITSRTRLGLPGEQEVPVPPLDVPAQGISDLGILEEYDAVKMFLEKAARARPGFTLATANAEAVAGICRLLEGMPLALELAASRVQIFTVAEIFGDLSREGLGDDRLMGIFQWSAHLLPSEIVVFLKALGVFRGGWTVQAAAHVAALEETRLAAAYLHYLLACSLIQATEEENGMRFRMLEPIRQMAERHLKGDAGKAEERHREYYRGLVRKVNVERDTAREESMVRELEHESANIIAALIREPNNQRRLFSAVDFHGLALYRGFNRTIRSILTELRPDGGTVKPQILARAWHAAGVLDAAVREWEMAGKAFRMAEELFLNNGEEQEAVAAKFNLASLLEENGRPEEAEKIFEDVLDFFRERGALAEGATVLANLVSVNLRLGRLERAGILGEECLRICENLDLPATQAHVRAGLAGLAVENKNWSEAWLQAHRSLELHLRLKQNSALAFLLMCFAQAAAGREEWEWAARLSGMVRVCIGKNSIPPDPELLGELSDVEMSARGRLGETRFQEMVRTGRQWSLERLLTINTAPGGELFCNSGEIVRMRI